MGSVITVVKSTTWDYGNGVSVGIGSGAKDFSCGPKVGFGITAGMSVAQVKEILQDVVDELGGGWIA